MKLFAVLALLVAAVSAAPAYGPGYHAKEYDSYAPAYYNFAYAVKDDYYNDFGHQEQRNGDNTKGSYHVVLPDGRRQVVNYYVDGYSGYVADVQYTGDYKAPAYKAPAHYPAKHGYAPHY